MEVLTAFLIGFLGSLHCIGMCGPIAVSLPLSEQRSGIIRDQILYHLGRTIAYSLLGAVVGIIGSSVRFAGLQGWLSILSGLCIIILMLFYAKVGEKIYLFTFLYKIGDGVKKLWPFFFQKKNWYSMLVIGVLNGFLPCGLVYMALLGAVNLGDVWLATGFMAMFGLGTVPVMAALVQCGRLLQNKFQAKLRWLLPLGAGLIALLLIMRGMSLGIPYLSPDLQKARCPHCTMEEQAK